MIDRNNPQLISSGPIFDRLKVRWARSISPPIHEQPARKQKSGNQQRRKMIGHGDPVRYGPEVFTRTASQTSQRRGASIDQQIRLRKTCLVKNVERELGS